jgi:pilus assembly protein CpaF
MAAMSVSERMNVAAQAAGQRGDGSSAWGQTAKASPTSNGVGEFKSKVHDALFERLGMRLFEAKSEDEMQLLVVAEITALMDANETALSSHERQMLAQDIARDVMGLGPIEQFLNDPTVSEIMVNGSDNIYVERSGVVERTDVRFISEDHLRRVVERIVSKVGRRIDESSPMVDARLSDGSRINVIVPPLSLDGPILTVRKFAKDPFKVSDLIEMGTMCKDVATMLSAAVEGGMNVLVSGGTGTGKTTLLNVLSSFIPRAERIVTIEDAVELQLHQDHVVRLEARPANTEGQGQITIRDLVRNALRMRPDRIIIGEVRGAEALDMLQAMNTGHDGSLSTVHANAPRDALSRLETMVLMAGFDLPAKAIREQVASALDLIVQIERNHDGSRYISHLTEVVGMEGDIVTLQDIYRWDHTTKALVSTGIRPEFVDELDRRGITVPGELFLGNGGWQR